MVFHLLRKRPKERSATPQGGVFADLCEQVLPVLAQHVDTSRDPIEAANNPLNNLTQRNGAVFSQESLAVGG